MSPMSTSIHLFLFSWIHPGKKIPPLVCGWLWFQTYFRFLSGILWIDMSQLEKGPKKDAQNGSPKKDLLQSAVARAWHLDTPILWWIFFLLPIFLVQILMARLLFLNLLSFQQEKHVNGIIDPHFCLFGPTFDRWNLHFDRWKPTFFEGEIPYLCLVIAEFWRLLQHPPCRRKFFARHLPWDDVWRGIDPRHFGRDAQENVMDLNDHCCWWFFWCSQFPTVEKIRTFPKIAYLLDTYFFFWGNKWSPCLGTNLSYLGSEADSVCWNLQGQDVWGDGMSGRVTIDFRWTVVVVSNWL